MRAYTANAGALPAATLISVQQAVASAMEYHERTAPNPDVALTRQISTLANLGERNEFWQRTLRAGHTSGVNAFLDENGPAELPQAVAVGYELFKRINAQSQKSASDHTVSDTRTFYQIAALSEKYGIDTDASSALARAGRATRSGAMPNSLTESIPRADFESSTKWTKDAANTSQLNSDIEMLARVFMASPGLDAKTALKEASTAVKASYTKSGGGYIYSAGRATPVNLDELATFAGRDYADKFGEIEGVRQKDIGLVPGPVPETWVLANMRLPGRPYVENWREHGLFTTADFARLEEARAKQAQLDIVEEQNRRNQRRDPSTQPGGVTKLRLPAVEQPFIEFDPARPFSNIAGPD